MHENHLFLNSRNIKEASLYNRRQLVEWKQVLYEKMTSNSVAYENQKVQHRGHKRPEIIHILGRIKPIPLTDTIHLKYKIVFASTPRSY